MKIACFLKYNKLQAGLLVQKPLVNMVGIGGAEMHVQPIAALRPIAPSSNIASPIIHLPSAAVAADNLTVPVGNSPVYV